MALRALCLGLLTVMLAGIPAQADASAGPCLATGIKSARSPPQRQLSGHG